MENNMIEEYFKAVEKGIAQMLAYPSKNLILLHHNDTDGLTSGALLSFAFGREGYDVKRFALEKPYPKVLEKIFAENSDKIIVFADFAGKIAPLICSLNKGKNLVILLDHHKAEKSTDNSVINLDPDLYGFKGDRDISASVTCWYFAVKLNNANKALAHIGALGGIADFYYLDSQVHGYNRKCLEEAVNQGTMRIEGSLELGKEKFYIQLGEKEFDVIELYPLLDIIGGVGFYGGGPELGIKMLLEGITDNDLIEIEKFSKIKDEKFSAELERLKTKGFEETEHIQWFDVKERFKPMGVKMIGVFCEELADSELADKSKYLAGFQTIPDEIPGFGKIEIGETKVSMRTSSEITEKILSGKIPPLNGFLPEATLNLGGFADACHRVAAATTIKVGMEKQLMDESEKVLKNLLKEK